MIITGFDKVASIEQKHNIIVLEEYDILYLVFPKENFFK